MADLEVVLKKELPPVFTGPVSHMRNLFGRSTQTTRPRERRCWWGSHAEMLKMSTHVPNSVLEPRPAHHSKHSDTRTKRKVTHSLHPHGKTEGGQGLRGTA
jgi:hypothetical protein